MNATWVLDLDNTLYPASNGLFALIDARIQAFMLRLGLAPADVPALRDRYRREYGLTLGGLMAHHGVDPDEYEAYVHDVPVRGHLSPDPDLDRALGRLAGRRVLFTNGTVAHAETVLSCLGVAHRIERIFDLAFMGYVPKPRPAGYRKLLEALGAEASRCLMVDDLAENLDTGAALGMTTILVGPVPRAPHLHVSSIKDLPDLLCPL